MADEIRSFYDGAYLDVDAKHIELTPEEAKAAQKAMSQYFVRKALEEQEFARKEGRVWYANYWRYHSLSKDEFFSLEDAVQFLRTGEDYGDLSASGGWIACPGGVKIEGVEMHKLMNAGRDDHGEDV